MVNVRIIAVALTAACFIACTNTDPAVPAELDAEPEQARSGAAAKGSSIEGDAELAAEETADAPEEDDLLGLPESAPAPSTSPPCGSGLTCSGTSVSGAKACKQEATSPSDVYCCPRKGDRIVAGKCIAKVCGSGLTCSPSPTTGATTCSASASSTTNVYCCPIKGWRIQNGQCIPPICGSGLVCSSASLSGASACRQTSTSTTNVYCCPSGQSVVNGKCQ